jgi:glycerol kinase
MTARMRYVLALDSGTTSSRALLFDRGGAIVGSGQQEFPQIFPKPGWVEHDPRDIWESQMGATREALRSAGATSRDIAAIGITNQRETTILWDRETGEPVSNAIVWQDRRTADLCERLLSGGHEEEIRRKTGLLLDPYFSASKIAWILEHVPGVRTRAEKGELAFGTVDTWLAWKLTGGAVHVTDPGNASRTMLFDIHALAWDADLLRLFGVPVRLLPAVRHSSEVYATATEATGLAGVPVAGIAGDQQAALFGQMCVEPGLAKCTYGTGCFLLQNTGAAAVASSRRLLTTVAWGLRGSTSYALEGSVFVGGAVVQWLRDGLGVIATASDVERLAASVPDSGGVCVVPAFTGLGAPHWDPHARGAILGITRGTTAGHIARAALESIALQVADLLEAMRSDSGLAFSELRADGGAAVNDGLLQFQSDLLGVPVVRPAVTETTALGAAYLAGLAVGFWDSPDQIAGQWREERRFLPSMPHAEVERRRSRWRVALDRAKGWERAAWDAG